jgi:hypothetical protein
VSTATPSGGRRERSSRCVQLGASLYAKRYRAEAWTGNKNRGLFSLLWCNRFGPPSFTTLNPDAADLWLRETSGEHVYFSTSFRDQGNDIYGLVLSQRRLGRRELQWLKATTGEEFSEQEDLGVLDEPVLKGKYNLGRAVASRRLSGRVVPQAPVR